MFVFSQQMELLAMAVRHHEYVDSGSGFALSCGLEKLFAKLDNSSSGKQLFAENNTAQISFPFYRDDLMSMQASEASRPQTYSNKSRQVFLL